MRSLGVFVIVFLVTGCSVPGHVTRHGPVKFSGAMPAEERVIVYEGEGREFTSDAVIAVEYEHRWILDGKKVKETSCSGQAMILHISSQPRKKLACTIF